MKWFAIFGSIGEDGVFHAKCGTDACISIDGRLTRENAKTHAINHAHRHKLVWPKDVQMYRLVKAARIRDIADQVWHGGGTMFTRITYLA